MVQGWGPSDHPGLEATRQAFLRAPHELRVAALQALVMRVRTCHPTAATLLSICDDVEDGLYLAELSDRRNRRLDAAGSSLEDRTCHQVLGELHASDLAVRAGVDHDPVAMTFEVRISAVSRWPLAAAL